MASRALLETVWKESFARVMGFAQENTVPGREEVTDLLSDREYWARLQSPGGAAALGVLLEAVTARLESQDEEISDLRRLSGLEGGNGGKTKADPTG